MQMRDERTEAVHTVMLTQDLLRWRPRKTEFMAMALLVGEFAAREAADVAKAEILQEYGIQVVKRELGTPKVIRVLAETEDGQRWELTYKLKQIDEAGDRWKPLFGPDREPDAVQMRLLEG